MIAINDRIAMMIGNLVIEREQLAMEVQTLKDTIKRMHEMESVMDRAPPTGSVESAC